MARDRGLEELLRESLSTVPNLSEKPMFGGLAYLVNGKLLCGARHDGMLARIGKDNEVWALKICGVRSMISRGRRMVGWVRAAPEAWGDDRIRQKLIAASLEFNSSLPG